MHGQIDDALDEIDAAVHSSDWLSDETERGKLKEFLRSWAAAVVEWETMPDDEIESDLIDGPGEIDDSDK